MKRKKFKKEVNKIISSIDFNIIEDNLTKEEIEKEVALIKEQGIEIKFIDDIVIFSNDFDSMIDFVLKGELND